MESDVLGNTKTNKSVYLTHTEIYQHVDEVIPAVYLKGSQRNKVMWRLCPDNEKDRDNLLTTGVDVRNKLSK